MSKFLRIAADSISKEKAKDSMVAECEIVHVDLNQFSIITHGLIAGEVAGMIGLNDFSKLIAEHNPTIIEVESNQSLDPLLKICKENGVKMVIARYNLDYSFSHYEELNI
ncbi:MAG TPA: hypothetical protein DCL21_03860 [Alphaproteobacteria bacterium]|nr:hypothetical protein [Alphaproteobacteria bacterium]